MSANAFPRAPFAAGGIARWTTRPGLTPSGLHIGGAGVWDATGSATRATWDLDDPAQITTWDNRDGVFATASFGGQSDPALPPPANFGVVVVGEARATALRFENGAAAPYQLVGDPIRLASSTSVFVGDTASAAIVNELAALSPADTPTGFFEFRKTGNGPLRLLAGGWVSGTQTLRVDAGRLEVIYAPAAYFLAPATNLHVAGGAEVVIESSLDIDLLGTLTGAGIIRIIGGGHLKYHGRDVKQRPIATIPGWSGTFDSPPVNANPVITSLPGTGTIYLPAGQASTLTIGASDADGDALILTLPSNPYPAEISVSGMTIVYIPTAAGRSHSIPFLVSDGFGGSVSGALTISTVPTYDVTIQGFTTPTQNVGPATRTLAAGEFFRVLIEGSGATVGGDHGLHLATAFSGAGTVAVTPRNGVGQLNLGGSSPAFTGEWLLPEEGAFVCAGDYIGGLSSLIPAHVPVGTFAANPGPSHIRAASGRLARVVFGGLAAGSSTITARISSARDVSFQGGAYTYSGSGGISCVTLGVFNASLTLAAGAPIDCAAYDLGWYVPGRAVAPLLSLGANPQWYGTRTVAFSLFAGTPPPPAGTHQLVSWTGSLADGDLGFYDPYLSQFVITTTATTKTWTKPGWGAFVFDRASGFRLIKY